MNSHISNCKHVPFAPTGNHACRAHVDWMSCPEAKGYDFWIAQSGEKKDRAQLCCS